MILIELSIMQATPSVAGSPWECPEVCDRSRKQADSRNCFPWGSGALSLCWANSWGNPPSSSFPGCNRAGRGALWPELLPQAGSG